MEEHNIFDKIMILLMGLFSFSMVIFFVIIIIQSTTNVIKGKPEFTTPNKESPIVRIACIIFFIFGISGVIYDLINRGDIACNSLGLLGLFIIGYAAWKGKAPFRTKKR